MGQGAELHDCQLSLVSWLLNSRDDGVKSSSRALHRGFKRRELGRHICSSDTRQRADADFTVDQAGKSGIAVADLSRIVGFRNIEPGMDNTVPLQSHVDRGKDPVGRGGRDLLKEAP
jgi:hypothetical protein